MISPFSHCQSIAVLPVSQPAVCVVGLNPTMVSLLLCFVCGSCPVPCCCVRGQGLLLLSAAIWSQHRHEDKPVVMLLPDLLRHPAATKQRNNYNPNYPGQLCPLFVLWRQIKEEGWGWGDLSSARGDAVKRDPTQKRVTQRVVSSCLQHCRLACLFQYGAHRSSLILLMIQFCSADKRILV